jgi:3-methylcrotonyl-CoA carboxylase alpha subunit
MRIQVRSGSRAVTADIQPDGLVAVDGTVARVDGDEQHGWRVTVNGRTSNAWIAGPAERPWIFFEGRVYRPEVGIAGRTPRVTRRDDDSLSAPMPATVRRVLVTQGQAVTRGEPVIVLEAMKMELTIKANADGRVTRINCIAGELVAPGVPLVEIQ